LLFADGKPLVFEGGEGGETWRHSTVSFHDAQMPPAAGHVERFCTLPGVDFVQGVHPEAIRPGEPVFLSDDCHHRLVDVARRRFAEPNPVDVRSVFHVRGEYVVVHDDLAMDPAIPFHWHLHVVADGESGCLAEGYRFTGRYGTDLQVLLPDQQFHAEPVET